MISITGWIEEKRSDGFRAALETDAGRVYVEVPIDQLTAKERRFYDTKVRDGAYLTLRSAGGRTSITFSREVWTAADTASAKERAAEWVAFFNAPEPPA